MRRLSAVSLFAVLLVAVPIGAQEVLDTQVFPVVARGAGLAGTMWVTDLVVTNPMDEPVSIGVGFFPANQNNLFDPTFPNRIELGRR